MADQSSGNQEMSASALAQDLVRQCAAPAEGLSIKAQIRRASTRLGMPYGRVKRLWYGEARVSGDDLIRLCWRVNEEARANDTMRENDAAVAALLTSLGADPGGGSASRR